jgi:hypothetical protein
MLTRNVGNQPPTYTQNTSEEQRHKQHGGGILKALILSPLLTVPTAGKGTTINIQRLNNPEL